MTMDVEIHSKTSKWLRALIVLFGLLGLFLLILGVAEFFIDEPLRGYMESKANANLKGYKLELGSVDFHHLGFSVDIENLILRQEAHPDPPLIFIPFWSASIQWTELLKLEIVSDHVIKEAKVALHFLQAEKEVKDPEELEERGWQEALYSLYPVTINTLRIEDSAFSFKDSDHTPLEVTHLQLQIENIQNIRSEEGEYPSSIHMEGKIPQSGSLQFTGRANFFAEPFPGVSGDFDVQQVELKPFIPVASLANLEIHSGTLNGLGHLEYSPWKSRAHLTRVELVNPFVNYVEKGQSGKVKQKGSESSKPGDKENSLPKKEPFQLVVDDGLVKNGEVGYVNTSTNPPYRIFFNNLEMNVSGKNTYSETEKSELHLSGKFMGSGNVMLDGVFRSDMETPDFEMKLKIEKTDMKTLNKLFKAYGEFDVEKGKFSLFSELKVHKGQVRGYIKPFFENPEVFDLSQEKTDNLFQQMYEGIVGGLSSLLESTPREQVATKTEISGNLKNVNVSTWELVFNLVKNAFFDSLTPAFENLKSMGEKR